MAVAVAPATGHDHTINVVPTTAHERMHTLYQVHAPAVYRFLLRLTFGERQAAEDLLQETMLRAWRNIHDLNSDPMSLRRWLYTVARRIAIDAGRAKQARPAEVALPTMAGLSTPDGAIDQMLAAQLVKQAMSSLSPDHRAVIIEIYFRDRPAAEAATRLGIPEGTVKSRTYHALRALRAALDPPT
jgi:RNA polymerase sigma-70 factor, ECF subfamily